ncbi:MAG: small multi-drug export protein [Candidatus Omnitrophica bacterium]|nr:small multi-drug export protein [Candidatus Omnitrophota bacterium]
MAGGKIKMHCFREILSYLNSLPKEYIVMITAGLPISELRGAIPLALSWGFSAPKAFWLAVIGNILPVAPVLFLLRPVSGRLRRFIIWEHFFDWLFERTKKKSDIIQKYEALGLALFVAIPLPMTGAWTGAIAASLFNIRFRYAFFAIILGVIGAGLVVLSFCILGVLGWEAIKG